MNRKDRKAVAKNVTFFRVVPLEIKPEAGPEDQINNISYVDHDFDECVVALVPNTTSYEMAREIENRLTTALNKNVLVMTENIRLCRVEGPVAPQKIEEMFKGAPDVDAQKIDSAIAAKVEEVEGTEDAEQRAVDGSEV